MGSRAPKVVGIAAILFVSAFMAAEATGQVGGAELLFQSIDPVSRSRALGETGVLLRGMPGVAALNPAAVEGDDQVRAHLVSMPWLPELGAGLELNTFSLAYGQSGWTVAYQRKHLDLGEHEVRAPDNTSLRRFHSYDVAHKLAGAYDLTPHLRLGAGLNYIHSEMGGSAGVEAQGGVQDVRTLTLDLGLHYGRTWASDFATFRPLAGWSLTDVGGTVEYVEGDPRALPTMMRGGLGLEVGLLPQWLNRPLLRLGHYQAAAKMIYARRDDGSPYGSLGALVHTWQYIEVDLTPQTPNDEVRLSLWDQLMWSRGTEVSMLDIISLRVGRFEEHEYNGARAFDTFGWGLDLYFIAVDVAMLDSDDNHHPLDDTQMTTFTVRVPLGGEAEGNFWPELLKRLGV